MTPPKRRNPKVEGELPAALPWGNTSIGMLYFAFRWALRLFIKIGLATR
jgi:hypothetical protein